MMVEKPTSFPPMVMLTNVVAALRLGTWLLITLAVVAPAQATDVYATCGWAAAHSAEKAAGLRSHAPPV